MKVWPRPFGCRANHYEAERVCALAGAAGHERQSLDQRRRVPDAVARCRAQALRAVGDARAAAWDRARAEGGADVVVIGSGRARAGLTGDYLTVTLSAPLPRRTGRFGARLEGDGTPLRAHPIDTAIS